jgi:thiol:disulfide interchange protein DsbD
MVFHDYIEGLQHAKKVNKPLMVDFTGHACVNCRKMEEQVWSNTDVKNTLMNDVVLVSLYVDERIDLPNTEQYTTTMAGKKKKVKATGDKWMVFQANTFGTNSQPYYVLLDHNENQLNEPANYQDYGSVPVFKDWISRGLATFNK